MFGNKNNEKTSGEDKLNTLAGKDSGQKPSASLEKTEGKKEKFAKLFSRKDKKEEKVSLYEPEMEFVTEEELKKEEAKKKDNMQPGEKNSLSGSGSILNNNNVLNDEKNGARSKIKGLFRKKETGAGAALPGGFSSAQKSLFDDDPILYEGEEKKGLGKLSKKKLAVIAGAAVIVIGAASYFILTNLGGSVDGTAYVESVKDIMGYGSGSGMNNRYTGEVEAQDSWDITLQSDLSVAECYVEEGAR